jgi:hypothetical protein
MRIEVLSDNEMESALFSLNTKRLLLSAGNQGVMDEMSENSYIRIRLD